MADIPIISPAAPLAALSGSQQSQSATEGAAVQHLPQGTVITGTVIGKDPSGNFLLRTGQGTVSVSSPTPLTYNSDVIIRLGAGSGSGTNARILSVNGESFSSFNAPATPESDSLSPSLLTKAAAPDTATLPETATVRALVTASPETAPPATPESATPQALPATGTVIILRAATPQAASPAPPETNTQGPAPAQTAAPNATAETIASPALAPNAPAAAQAAPEPQAPANAATNPVPTASAPAISSPTASQPSATVPTTTAEAATVSPTPVIATPATSPQAPASSPQAQTTTPAAEPVAAPAQTVTTAGQAQAASSEPQLASQPAASSAQYAAYARPPASSPETPAPAEASVSTEPTAAPAPIPARIISQQPDGTVTLATPNGTLTVKPDALPPGFSLAPGSAVIIEIPVPPLPVPPSSLPASFTELSTGWSTLNEIAGQTGDPASSAPSAAQSLLRQLPQIGPGFAAATLSFLTAAAQGNVRKLLGDDTVSALRQNGRLDLLEKFSGEVATIAQFMSPRAEQQSPGWQAMLIPFVFQEAIEQARLYVKRDPPRKDKSHEKSSDDTRFVVEVDLSELGALQLDGLVRKAPESTAFDLVIRSRVAFPPAQQAEIMAIYNESAQLTGFRGSIGFQVARDFPVKPLDEMHTQDLRDFTV